MSKSSNKSNKNSAYTVMQQKAENNITIVICSIILYGLIMFSLHAMANNSASAAAVPLIRKVLIFAGIIGAMGLAIYSAYKSNKSLLKYSFMCLYISISTVGIQYCHYRGWGLKVSVIGLFIAFLFTCIYAVLTDKKIYYTSKKARVIFRSVLGAIYGFLLVSLIIAFFLSR